VLTRYDDVKAVCMDRERVSSDRLRPFFRAMPGPEAERIADIVRYLSLWMVFKDPPEHTRLRRLASKVFTVKSMQGMRGKAAELSEWLLDRVEGRDEIDLIADFAGPLPCLVIMEMLGVPREHLAHVKRLSDEIAQFIGSARTQAEKYDTAQVATREMAAFFREMIAERRREPGDDGDGFSGDELVATCILMLFAGHETTTNHIANGMLALMRFPGEMARLRADPSLAPRAVEELLRYDGPTGAQVRIVVEPHALHGRTLEPGQRVFLMLNAANRDPRAYPDPDRVDLTREGPPHLAFGFGMHICLGFPLARTEGEVALPALLARYRSIEPTTAGHEWLDSLVFRGMTSLPVRVARA
jgi:hypothetical protein